MAHSVCCPRPITVIRREPLGLGALAASFFALMSGGSPAGSSAGGAPAAGPGAIDVHAHFYPESFLRSLADEGAPPHFPLDMSDPQRPVVAREDFRLEIDPTYWDLERRLKRMDSQRVQLHALSLTLPMVHWAEPQRGAQLARIVNEAMAEAHTAFPERFVGCAALPLQDVALALAELERIAGQPAFRGVYFPTNIGGQELSLPALFPLYEQCERLGLPVLLHPVGVIGVERLQSYYLYNLLGNPFDTTVAAAHLVFGGVLDRFPALQVVLPHAGGALPALWGRLQHGQQMRPEAQGRAQRPFGEYLTRFHYDTIGHAPQIVRTLVDQVGADRVMLGSDYCFDMGSEQPRDIVTQLGLSMAEQDKILRTNAEKLLRL